MNPLAVYGTLKNSNIGMRIGSGILKGGVLVLPEHGMFPAWVDLAPYDEGTDTVVDLYDVTDDALNELDRYEGVWHSLYIRTVKTVQISELSEHGILGYDNGEVLDAYVYKAGRVVEGADSISVALNPEGYIKHLLDEVWKSVTNGNWKPE